MPKPAYTYIRNVASYFAIQSKTVNITEDYVHSHAYLITPTYANTVYNFGFEIGVFDRKEYDYNKMLDPVRQHLSITDQKYENLLKKLILSKNSDIVFGIKLFGQAIPPYIYIDNTDIFLINTLPNTKLAINMEEENGKFDLDMTYDIDVVANTFKTFTFMYRKNVPKLEVVLYDNLFDYLKTMIRWLQHNFIYPFDGRLSTTEAKIISSYYCYKYLTGYQFFPKYQKQLYQKTFDNIAIIYNINKVDVKSILNNIPDKEKSFLTIEDVLDLHVESDILPNKISTLNISIKLLRFTLYGTIFFTSLAGYSLFAASVFFDLPILIKRLVKDIYPFWYRIAQQYEHHIT